MDLFIDHLVDNGYIRRAARVLVQVLDSDPEFYRGAIDVCYQAGAYDYGAPWRGLCRDLHHEVNVRMDGFLTAAELEPDDPTWHDLVPLVTGGWLMAGEMS